MDRPNRSPKDTYDVSTYTDQELFDILDVNSPTDRELEAKILFLIHKYENLQNESGNQLAQFFNDIYKRFFEVSDDEESNELEENIQFQPVIEEGFDAMGTSTKIGDLVKSLDKSVVTNTVSAIVKDTEKTISKDAPVGYTKTLDYSLDKLNPLLKQTTTKLIVIDSQYRDNKKNLSTDFTLQLSEPLKDVVSMKLYSFSIPYTWYTISTDFGSNLFYLKGNTPGIANGNHDYKVEITPGNYSPADLAMAINESISSIKTTNTDVSFGTTGISYNSYNSLMTTTIDINKQFNETGYQLIFPDISSASPYLPDTQRTGSTNVSIAEFLGFANKVYTLYYLKGGSVLPLTTSITAINDDTNLRIYRLTAKNNYFTVLKYIGPQEDNSGSIIDFSFNIYFSLTTGQTYTRRELVTDISNQIAINSYLDASYSYLQRFDVSATTLDPSMAGYSTNSFYQLAIKPNRKTTNNIPNSKTKVIFSTDPSYSIWYGANSCFQFTDSSGECNNIVSDTAPIGQQNLYFDISKNYIYVQFNCIKKGFDISINNYVINVAKSTAQGYKIADYLVAINNGITAASTKSNGEINSNYSTAFLDGSGAFNMTIDLTKQINQTSYLMDLSGWVDVSGYYFPQQSGSLVGSTYKRLGFLTDFAAVPPTQVNFANQSNIVNIVFDSQGSYTIRSEYLACFQTSGTTNSNISSYITYSIPSPTGTYGSLSDLAAAITAQFNNFTDSDGKAVFSGTTFTATYNPVDNNVTGTLTILINKQISQNDYSIQFFDIGYVTQNQFYMDLSGYVDNSYNYVSDVSAAVGNIRDISNNKIGFLNTCLGLSGNLGYNVSGGIYDMSSSNVFYSSANLQNIRSIFNISGSLFNTKYLAYFNKKSTASYQYGTGIAQNTSTPYNYWVPSPTTAFPLYSASSDLVIAIQNSINKQFSTIPDLSGTNIAMRINPTNSQAVDCSLTVVVNQPYNKYTPQSSWYNNLYVDQAMIQDSYPFYKNGIFNTQTSLVSTGVVISYQAASSIGIRGYRDISQNQLYLNSTNNYFTIVPFQDGVSCEYDSDATINSYNTVTITVPYSVGGVQIPYTRDNLIAAINTAFASSDVSGSTISIGSNNLGAEYTKIRLLINKQYGAKDYRLVFYDPYSFVKCFVGASSIKNTTWDSTVGWILGYRESTVYSLQGLADGLTPIQITGDTGVSTNLFNYFIISMDDFNQNHLNDGLVTITPREITIPLPSYANKSNFTCDPVTGKRSYNTSTPTDLKRLTQNQIYSLTEIANSSGTNATTNSLSNSVSIKSYSQGPYVQDVFAIIPLRVSGLENGSYYTDNGGSLQNQQRLYFGPINLYKLAIKLVDDRGNTVNLNNANWSFSIICEMLYKPKPSA